MSPTHQNALATIAIRPSRPADASDLARLAALDSSLPLTGDVLLATIDGEPLAALQLSDGRTVADPFARTTELVALLRVRAGASARPRLVRHHRAPSAPVARVALAP